VLEKGTILHDNVETPTTRLVFKPMKKTVNFTYFGLIAYFQNQFELFGPLTTTFTPGWPSASETTPVTVFSCATQIASTEPIATKKIHLYFDFILINLN
jgi:hypothetical protein